MPWFPEKDPDIEYETGAFDDIIQHYEIPRSYCTLDTGDYARSKRKIIGQEREEILRFQSACRKQKDMDGARYFRDVAAELQKQYRAWDFCVKWLEGDNINWRHEQVSEAIAPYCDRAFSDMQCI